MRSVMGNRCVGHCCKDIGLSQSPEQLEHSYRRWVADQSYDSIPIVNGDQSASAIFGEVWLLYPMLTFIKKDLKHPEGSNKKPVYHYKCKNFDSKKKICTIYDIRPSMCRSFGSGDRGCGYKSCKWDSATKKWKNNQKKIAELKGELDVKK